MIESEEESNDVRVESASGNPHDVEKAGYSLTEYRLNGSEQRSEAIRSGYDLWFPHNSKRSSIRSVAIVLVRLTGFTQA